MAQPLRDRIRMRWPRAVAFAQRRIRPLLPGDKRAHRLGVWAQRGAQLVDETGMHGIRFERDGIWIQDGTGALWSYTPGLFASTLWAEFGVRYEEAEIEALAQRLGPGSVFVDIGANVGLHSIHLARQIDGLRILAFEPVGRTIETLKRNLAKNGVADRVEIHHVALADEPGELTMTTSFQVGNFVVPEGATADRTERVACARLDDVLNGSVDRVDVIKCDVEGAELGVLKGAQRTLERHRPILLLEIDDRWAARYGHSGEAVFDFLAARGYAHERVGDSQNFLFTPGS